MFGIFVFSFLCLCYACHFSLTLIISFLSYQLTKHVSHLVHETPCLVLLLVVGSCLHLMCMNYDFSWVILCVYLRLYLLYLSQEFWIEPYVATQRCT